MNNKEKILSQVELMEDRYLHSMRVYYAFLSEKFEEIDSDKNCSDLEMMEFFKRNNGLYETWWLDWYQEAIWVFKSYAEKINN